MHGHLTHFRDALSRSEFVSDPLSTYRLAWIVNSQERKHFTKYPSSVYSNICQLLKYFQSTITYVHIWFLSYVRYINRLSSPWHFWIVCRYTSRSAQVLTRSWSPGTVPRGRPSGSVALFRRISFETICTSHSTWDMKPIAVILASLSFGKA